MKVAQLKVCSTYQEAKEVPGDVPDAKSKPLRPHSEEKEEESEEDHEDQPERCLDRTLLHGEDVESSWSHYHVLEWNWEDGFWSLGILIALLVLVWVRDDSVHLTELDECHDEVA